MEQTRTFKVKSGCKRCSEDLYYYPSNLLLESKFKVDASKKRVITLSCCNGDTKHVLDYIFPNEFEEI